MGQLVTAGAGAAAEECALTAAAIAKRERVLTSILRVFLTECCVLLECVLSVVWERWYRVVAFKMISRRRY